MTVPFSAAANAYGALANLGQDATKAKGAPKVDMGGEGPNFGGMVNNSIMGLVQQGQATENAALQSTVGKASIVDAVTSLTETELQLQTLVTVRDKVIEAYEKIMQMPV